MRGNESSPPSSPGSMAQELQRADHDAGSDSDDDSDDDLDIAIYYTDLDFNAIPCLAKDPPYLDVPYLASLRESLGDPHHVQSLTILERAGLYDEAFTVQMWACKFLRVEDGIANLQVQQGMMNSKLCRMMVKQNRLTASLQAMVDQMMVVVRRMTINVTLMEDKKKFSLAKLRAMKSDLDQLETMLNHEMDLINGHGQEDGLKDIIDPILGEMKALFRTQDYHIQCGIEIVNWQLGNNTQE
jgi:hypothetical protein